MTLDPKCIRDILWTVEETTTPDEEFIFKNSTFEPKNIGSFPRLSGYTVDEVVEHINQCKLQGLFTNCVTDILDNITISGLSPDGYTLLNQLRNDKIWKKIVKFTISNLAILIETVRILSAK